jgi:indole-3-glycerol phosphate synthase
VLAAQLVREHRERATLLVGVNCRDLTTLKVVPGRLEALAPMLPRAVPRVAESGVRALPMPRAWRRTAMTWRWSAAR